jgi:phenylpropionate dioxygenase-like ring-hydroxylating dioxygenase large terminal subunit
MSHPFLAGRDMTRTDNALPGISAEAVACARLPLESASTLPPAAYVSEAIYELELERIMRRSWIPLARLDQIPEPGDYLSVDLAGQPVMVVHGTDGVVRVLSRICLHRAADLAPVSGRRKLFTCPYHAWAYDTTGQLVRAPLMDGARGFEETNCALPQIRTEIWEGFVLANLDADAAPLAPQIESFTRYFSNFKLADLEIVRTLTWESDWNWKVLVENFMEAYHHTGTHAKTLEPEFHAADSRIPDNDGPWSILHMPAAPHHAPAGPELISGLTASQRRDIVAAVVFPHFMLLTYSGGVAWYQVLPRSAGRLTLNIHLCLPRSARALEAFDTIVEASAAGFAHIHAEDIEANDLVWRGLNAPLTAAGHLSPLERSIWQLNQLWLAGMGA